MIPVTVLILAKDEVVNLVHTLPLLVEWAQDVVVIDSFSTDGTPELARKMGARVLQNNYEYHAQQINWGLGHLGEASQDWILLLNADELPDEALREEIARAIDGDRSAISGYILTFKVFFMGRWIRHGGTYPLHVLRLFRRSSAWCEDRRMDEKIVVNGAVGKLAGHVIDENRKDLSYFILKHDAYASREAQDYLRRRRGELTSLIEPRWFGDRPQRRRKLKSVYDRLPLFLRATLYYWYRMYLRLGVLDGPEGRVWHFLQGYWYRYLVDVKILEMRKRGEGASGGMSAP